LVAVPVTTVACGHVTGLLCSDTAAGRSDQGYPSSNPEQFFTSSETTALIVLQHGKLVMEHYYNGADRSTMITSWSDTKSWDSAMVGAAIAAGYLQSLDDPVTAYIPELATKDPRFSSITIRDLLEMRSGLDFNISGLPIDTDDAVVGNSTLSARLYSTGSGLWPPLERSSDTTTSIRCCSGSFSSGPHVRRSPSG